jgi:hypothetical protein
MAGKKTGEAPEPQKVKFIQICGDADGLYALSEAGEVFVYDDEGEGWFQLEFDDVRQVDENEET